MSAKHDDDTKHAYANLTDEEREAIEAGEADERAALAALAEDDDDDGQSGDDGDDADEADDADDGADDGAKGEPAAAPAKGAAETAEPAPKAEAAPARDPAVIYKPEIPADLDQQEAALKERRKELKKKWDDGEVDSAEYHDQLEQLTSDMLKVERLRTKAEIAGEMAQQHQQSAAQSAQQRWESAQVEFLDAQAAAGMDYRKDPKAFAQLDRFIRVLAADEGNNDKPMGWFLEEAHRSVRALRGAVTPAADPAGKGKDTGKPKGRTPQSVEGAATLANVPGADGPGDVAGEFADLDALDGEALEDAIARMSPAQRAKYAKGTA